MKYTILTQLIFWLGYSEPRGIAVHEERGDPPVAYRRVGIRKDYKYAGNIRVRYPHLGAVDNVVIAVFLGHGFQRKRVRSRARLRQTKAARVLVG